jgi:general secretion pathway protein F
VKHFHYSGRQGQGTLIKGWVMAEDREDALQQLRGRDVSPYTVAPGPGHIPLKVPVAELLVTLRELASLRRSGMAIDESVQAVIDTTEHNGLKLAWNQIAEMIHSGMSLSDSCAALPEYFPRYAVPLIRLGEANGQIAVAITLTADRLDEESRLQGEVRSALAYPVFLLVTCVSVLLFLFVVVIPKFGTMVDQGDGGSMGLLLAISAFLRDYLWLWMGGLSISLLALVYFSKTGQLQASMWRLMQRLPLIREIVQAWEVVQFCSSMARLLPGGVSLLDALNLSAEALGRESIRKSLKQCADQVRQGEGFGPALAAQEVFPKLVVQMISVGEKSAHLAVSMEEISALFERRMRDGIQRVLSLLEPAVIVIMGLAVGGIMVSLLSAIVTMNDIPI